MLLNEIFQTLSPAENDKLEAELKKFDDTIQHYVTGPTGEDRQKGYYLQIFEKAFRYGFFNQCIKTVEGADIEVKSLIPKTLWNHCQKHRDAKYDSWYKIN